jgi:hypothetical protein
LRRWCLLSEWAAVALRLRPRPAAARKALLHPIVPKPGTLGTPVRAVYFSAPVRLGVLATPRSGQAQRSRALTRCVAGLKKAARGARIPGLKIETRASRVCFFRQALKSCRDTVRAGDRVLGERLVVSHICQNRADMGHPALVVSRASGLRSLRASPPHHANCRRTAPPSHQQRVCRGPRCWGPRFAPLFFGTHSTRRPDDASLRAG